VAELKRIEEELTTAESVILRRASDRPIPNQALKQVEGVETEWRASRVDEGTVRFSSKLSQIA
jgi:hypothetical protein